MDQPAIIGIDLAKSVFQAHGVRADGSVVLRRQLRRGQVLALANRSLGRADTDTKPVR